MRLVADKGEKQPVWLSDFESAWLNFLESIRGHWNAWLPDLGLCIKGVELQPGRERNIRDHQRASESIREWESRRDVLTTSLCREVWPCHRHLKSVVCSSTNIATESSVELCEHPGTLSSVSTRATAVLWTIQQSSRTIGLHWAMSLRTSTPLTLGHRRV